MIATESFYVPADGPPRQGDILLAGVVRVSADDAYTPTQWRSLDAFDVTVEQARHDGDALRLKVGSALVMVTSHDCHFDKEWNRRRSSLIREGIPEREAERLADDDDELDRFFNASPLISPDDLAVDRGNLMAGRLLGYMPVPESTDKLVPESVVDLTYRVTLDRRDIVRVASISEEARRYLRFALAQLDSLRSPSVGFRIEDVIGKQIEGVEFPKKNPLLVRLRLAGGEVIELLQQPGEPPPGPARKAVPRSR